MRGGVICHVVQPCVSTQGSRSATESPVSPFLLSTPQTVWNPNRSLSNVFGRKTHFIRLFTQNTVELWFCKKQLLGLFLRLADACSWCTRIIFLCIARNILSETSNFLCHRLDDGKHGWLKYRVSTAKGMKCVKLLQKFQLKHGDCVAIYEDYDLSYAANSPLRKFGIITTIAHSHWFGWLHYVVHRCRGAGKILGVRKILPEFRQTYTKSFPVFEQIFVWIFPPTHTMNAFRDSIREKGLHVILHTLGASFSKSHNVGHHFCPHFQVVSPDFQVLANIFVDFARIFDKSKLLGVCLHPPAPPPPTPLMLLTPFSERNMQNRWRRSCKGWFYFNCGKIQGSTVGNSWKGY